MNGNNEQGNGWPGVVALLIIAATVLVGCYLCLHGAEMLRR